MADTGAGVVGNSFVRGFFTTKGIFNTKGIIKPKPGIRFSEVVAIIFLLFNTRAELCGSTTVGAFRPY